MDNLCLPLPVRARRLVFDEVKESACHVATFVATLEPHSRGHLIHGGGWFEEAFIFTSRALAIGQLSNTLCACNAHRDLANALLVQGKEI